ncbi:uncharacterized protein FOMMEDRAFT_18603 [Fomitiporia mediterranea MF3/22]|uniref:uncharacterized protein n=1 Tax=Fomitiporia mediterranea (strain MF3/22) TaxID=694068 RepID=UPI000440899B|nr:uncharacterized protein FOMMEDRAFT_18603 [Fomitiporia mediterranea MF3/22]EJD04880.1 hypothetical protein FOMMEDRAFT_18603 [Fomitiporia mediterranea MF3/22]
MLASFSSLLPSGIGFGGNKDERERERQDKERERERATEEETPRPNDNDGKLKDNAVDEQGVKKKRERNPNETFIVVRPPPSVSNHPLNLQLQLVPPQAKERSVSGTSSASGLSNMSNRASVDYSAQAPEEGGETLSRAESLHSSSSNLTSFYASSSSVSMSSIASSASTTSAGGGRRMIVPLYNLSAHNVMTNTVLDAGTDAKVAKFHKRSMEVLGLAILECVEVWPSYGRRGTGHIAFLSASNGANAGAAAGTLDAEPQAVTPTSSAISLSSAGSHPPHVHTTPTQATSKAATSSSYTSRGSVTPTPSQSGAKRIFGKIFKKRDGQGTDIAESGGSHSRSGSVTIDIRGLVVASPPGSESGHGSGFSPVGASKRRSLNASSPTPSHFTIPPVPGQPSGTQPFLQPAILGIQPTLSAPSHPPAGRPTRYVWIVRKWLKGSEGGLLGGVMRGVGMVGAGIGMSGLAERAGGGIPGSSMGSSGNGIDAGVEVRFEWVRGQSKSQEKGRRRKSAGQAALGKRGSTNFSQEEGGASRSRRSLATEVPGGRQEKSRSRARKADAASGAGPTTPRMSGESKRSVEQASRDSRTNSLTSASLSEEAQAALRGSAIEEDDGEESDPEDSETPWSCTVVVSSMPSNPSKLWEYEPVELHHPLGKEHSRRSQISSTYEGSSSAGTATAVPPTSTSSDAQIPPPPPPKSRPDAPGTLLRLKVGALSPAPHHPKVVAQLKVPYPLPDIEVARARLRRRVLTPAGVARPVSSRPGTSGAGGGDRDERDRPRTRSMFGGNGGSNGGGGGPDDEGLILTAEEIKDVLSCTAFWIVVREGFGGVGKVNRKGDGWRIRG